MYNKINDNLTLENKYFIHINNNSFTKPNLLINNVNEFQNLNESSIYWHYTQ